MISGNSQCKTAYSICYSILTEILELQFCIMFISSVQVLIQQAHLVCVCVCVCWHLLEAHGTGL